MNAAISLDIGSNSSTYLSKQKATFSLNQLWKFIFLDCNVIQFKVGILHSFAASKTSAMHNSVVTAKNIAVTASQKFAMSATLK